MVLHDECAQQGKANVAGRAGRRHGEYLLALPCWWGGLDALWEDLVSGLMAVEVVRADRSGSAPDTTPRPIQD